MKTARHTSAILAIAALSTLLMLPATQAVASNRSKKGEKPAASPGWLIIDEDYWLPLRFEPLYTLDAVGYHYRRGEEKAAANEIEKAVSWLRIAEAHAMPITKGKLTKAADELTTVAKDLRGGRIVAASRMDGSMARAAQALAEWHYYNAKESCGKNEEAIAGEDLEMAALYLEHAATSAQLQFGPDTQEVLTEVYRNGKMRSETTTFDHNSLAMQLKAIEKAVKELGSKMVSSTS
jgi:hypothetical protein